MSNSSLVNYTRLSPNCSKPRNHAIDTITIHHMAGNLSVETCGNVFAKTSRQASSNYGIGSDGRVGLYVDEANRSWCSGNRANDHRAITIEVANDNTKTWTVSDSAMTALINLLVDICKRNGIKKLVWDSNKSNRVNHVNGANMTLHKDFAATGCPGPYLESKMKYIANSVNAKLNTKEPEVKKEPEIKKEPEVKISKKSNDIIAQEVIQGKWGNGEARKKALTEAGYDYEAIQSIVSEKLNSGNKVKSSKSTYNGILPNKFPSRGYYMKSDGSTINKTAVYQQNIKYIQSFLNWAVYSGLAVDGHYGPLTVSAVKAFQKAVKIRQDGLFGPITLEKAKIYKR